MLRAPGHCFHSGGRGVYMWAESSDTSGFRRVRTEVNLRALLSPVIKPSRSWPCPQSPLGLCLCAPHQGAHLVCFLNCSDLWVWHLLRLYAICWPGHLFSSALENLPFQLCWEESMMFVMERSCLILITSKNGEINMFPRTPGPQKNKT